MRRALAGCGAVALVGLVPSSCGSFIGLGPCPASSYDVCYYPKQTVLETAHTSSGVRIESWIVLSVNRHPQALHVIADLQWWDRHSVEPHWATVDTETYGIAQLPRADGKEHRVNPRLEYACTPGRWRVVVHYSVKSSTGQHQQGTAFYPGPRSSSSGKSLSCRPPS